MFLCTASVTNWNIYFILAFIGNAICHANVCYRSLHNWKLSAANTSNNAFVAILLETSKPYQNQTNAVNVQNSQKMHYRRMLETHMGESVQTYFVLMEGNQE
jgi:hypothetical protein